MSDSGDSDFGVSMSSIAPESAASNSQPIALSDVSPQDKPWDKHRSFADRVEGFYAGSEFNGYSSRIHYCSELLEFGLAPTEHDTLKLKLRSARFCRLRHCPVCQWRRSLMWKAKAYKVLPKIVEAYPSHRWLFLTLTQKNAPIVELRETLKQMNRGYQRLVQLKAFPGEGWLRSTEVTRGRDGSAHPHFHCLLLVQRSYFGKKYIRQDEWVEMWRKCMRLDYNPVLDVQAVKQGSKPMELVPELLKYCTKESDLVADREWFLELTRQMHKMRAVATGGVLKEYLKELEEEPEDLIGNDDQSEMDDKTSVYFSWRRKEKMYRLSP
ncbi:MULTISPECIES: protein rep [Cyanophyceae]|uniref:Protein rep n=1 Tax=Stenomitos frigidus AS-A4 TaxID=2933935 RepID=A0ABV0KEJ2_9CYAN|nr:protein rep [Phormidium sp. FACHB-592]